MQIVCYHIKKFVFVRDNMKTTLFIKLMMVFMLCIAVLFAFTACKEDEIYAGSEDFESYPDYWNDFNDDSGDIYIPDTNSPAGDGNSSNDGTTSSEVEDWTANFDEDEDEDVTSSKTETDTDKDGTPDTDDTDDDNDGITDDKDPDDDNNGTPDDEEEPDYGNQGPLVFF